MDYLPKDELLKDLPLLLAGPILRRTEATSVTVWVALKQPCRVSLQIFETQQAGEQLGQCVFRGERETIALGQYLHVVAVTAQPLNPELGSNAVLESDRLYAYGLDFTAQDCTCSLAAALSRPHRRTESKPESKRESKAAADTESISYFAHQKPTFALPPQALRHLKIVHGSCRKPHGEGFDALPILDCLIAAEAHNPQARPHQLLMTGDQIYGDDVADPLLWIATPLGDALLGWEERLPLDHSDANAPTDGLNWGARPKQLPAGQRARFATEQAGLTAGLTGKEERTTSHLLGFGEYCAAYLLAHSPACWPARLPDGKEVTQDRKTIRRWEDDKGNMEQFLYSLWKVRRLLANVATYTIFDDHDVSDDWNLNQAWCLRILGKPLGYQAVQNALLAYAAFQAWGNTPQQFEVGTSGSALLLAAQQWSKSQGEDLKAKGAIATYLGLPPINPHTGLPEFVEDGHVWILQRSEKALTWHYTIRSACHEVIVLDTRTYRGYPIEGKPIDPPMLLSPSAFKEQISDSLTQSPLPSIYSASNNSSNSSSDSGSDTASAYATFIVAPTNVFGMRVLDWIQQWHLNRRKVFSADVGDSWNFHDQALAMLLTTLFQHRKDVVVLSGDIHYSSAIHVNYEDLTSGYSATLVQLTASAMKNEELLTRILHTRLKDWLLPEKPRQWVGQFSPANMTELPVAKAKTQQASKLIKQAKQQNISADWRCQMRWLQRQRTEPLNLTDAYLNELIPPRVRSQNPWLAWFKFWKARWFQEGQEVVGINNIALVYFQPDNKLDSQLNSQLGDNQNGVQPDNPRSIHSQNLVVKQAHYWFSPWFPVQVVRSRFK